MAILCDKETRSGVENFKDLDLAILTSLSNQAAVAMDNAKLLKAKQLKKYLEISPQSPKRIKMLSDQYQTLFIKKDI